MPTIAESGFPGYEMRVWWGFFGPAGMQPDLVAKLNKAIVEIIQEPATHQKLNSLGYELTPSTPAEFKAYVEAENKKWSTLIKSEGLASQ